MTSTLRYLALCLAAVTAACGEDGRDPAAPEPATPPGTAAVQAITSAPALRLDAHTLYYCYSGGNRLCMVLSHQVRVTSSGAALKWTASKKQPWIVLSASGGTTPSTLTISVDPRLRPTSQFTAGGTVTITAAGASNSPQTITVVLNGQRPPGLALSDSAIGFCYFPASVRACFNLAEDVRVTSTTATALTWRAVSSAPWIVIHPTSGTTPTTLRVTANLNKVGVRLGDDVTGSITISSGAAYNTPLTIPVKLQFYSYPLPQ